MTADDPDALTVCPRKARLQGKELAAVKSETTRKIIPAMAMHFFIAYPSRRTNAVTSRKLLGVSV